MRHTDLPEQPTHPRAEVEEAFAEFRRRGEQAMDWPAWADLFTDEALYEEHHLGTFEGRPAIAEWIDACMRDYPTMTLWVDWVLIDGNHVSFSIWNNLPDPTGTGRRFGFPNTTFLEYAGDGRFRWEADFYNPADAERVFKDWIAAGGRRHTPPDPTLRGMDGWSRDPVATVFPRDEVERELKAYRQRGVIAVETGDWNQWADQFTDDAYYVEHHYGRFEGQAAIRNWINGVMQPFPTMEFPIELALIDGNRVSCLIPNVLPDPAGGDAYFGFDVNTILHYAGNGKWSYEEDVYNPREAERAIRRWVKAGGQIPPA